MVPKKAKFLLDECLDVRLSKILNDFGLSCFTLRDKGWTGIKNGQLSQLAKVNDFILITYDKDFTFLWDKYKIQVIYVSIHPKTLQNSKPHLIRLFQAWDYNLSKPFLIILQEDSIRVRQ